MGWEVQTASGYSWCSLPGKRLTGSLPGPCCSWRCKDPRTLHSTPLYSFLCDLNEGVPRTEQSTLSSGTCLITDQSTRLYLQQGSFHLPAMGTWQRGVAEPPRKRQNSLNNSSLAVSRGPAGHSSAEEKQTGWAAQPRPRAEISHLWCNLP